MITFILASSSVHTALLSVNVVIQLVGLGLSAMLVHYAKKNSE